eukprot:gb/GFBE01020495.1/.p1 GENE.gb/GFBE01020495.1/~~gb/GFBE01020495.1/.p1  ORF type:complete len:837 (+),score=124.53 gb/GFBE01020495.1/:1-2511(+)
MVNSPWSLIGDSVLVQSTTPQASSCRTVRGKLWRAFREPIALTVALVGALVFSDGELISLSNAETDARHLQTLDSGYIEGEEIHQSYKGGFLVLSLAIACVGAYIAFTTASYMRLVRKTRWYYVLLIQAGLALGVSTIWSMHFVGMRALVLEGGSESGSKGVLEVRFEITLTLSSGIIAWIMACFAMNFSLSRKVENRTARDREAIVRIVGSTVLLAVGVGAMHYLGMLSQRGEFEMVYNPFVIIASVIIAVLVCASGLTILLFFPDKTIYRLLAAVIIGLAVSAVHYTGMFSAVYIAHPNGIEWGTRAVSISSDAIVIAVLFVDVALMASNAFYVEVIQVMDKKILEKELEHEGFIATSKALMKRSKAMQFPMTLLRAPVFLKLGRLVAYESLRDRKLLLFLDTPRAAQKLRKNGLILFFSHQWLSSNYPDPTGIQFQDMVCAVHELARSRRMALENIYIWVDYCGIPQCSADQQQLAINSLPAYVSACSAFVVIAPQILHSVSQVPCNFTSYSNRFWCRLEVFCAMISALRSDNGQDELTSAPSGLGQLGEEQDDEEEQYELNSSLAATHRYSSCSTSIGTAFYHGQRVYFVVEGKLQALAFFGPQGLRDEYERLLHVYDGKLDCCERGHRTASGEEVSCDKVRVVEALTGMYGNMLVQLYKLKRRRGELTVYGQGLVALGDMLVTQAEGLFPEEYFSSRIEAVHDSLDLSRGYWQEEEVGQEKTSGGAKMPDLEGVALDFEDSSADESSTSSKEPCAFARSLKEEYVSETLSSNHAGDNTDSGQLPVAETMMVSVVSCRSNATDGSAGGFGPPEKLPKDNSKVTVNTMTSIEL